MKRFSLWDGEGTAALASPSTAPTAGCQQPGAAPATWPQATQSAQTAQATSGRSDRIRPSGHITAVATAAALAAVRNPTRHTIAHRTANAAGNRTGNAIGTAVGYAVVPAPFAAPIPIPVTVPVTAATLVPPSSAPVSPAPALDELLDEPDEFGGLEGFGEEGVHADVETGVDLVLRARADDGEGQVVGTGIGAQPGGGAQSVQPGHDDVERHDIGPHLMHHVQTLGTIGRGHDLEPFQFEVDPDQLPDDLVVVHNKHPTRGAWHKSRVGPDRPPRPGFPHFHPLQVTRPTPPRETDS